MSESRTVENARAWAGLDEAQLASIARSLAPAIPKGGVVYLYGELGAGKTHFVRALLQGLGVGERVKSPTYSLVESYSQAGRAIHHLDLYRIADPDELEWLGMHDLTGADSLLLVEWPERGVGRLPPPDVEARLTYTHQAPGRDLKLTPITQQGGDWVAALNSPID